eukprot:11147159-Alexandrium_andersonii.AAC.1
MCIRDRFFPREEGHWSLIPPPQLTPRSMHQRRLLGVWGGGSLHGAAAEGPGGSSPRAFGRRLR